MLCTCICSIVLAVSGCEIEVAVLKRCVMYGELELRVCNKEVAAFLAQGPLYTGVSISNPHALICM